MASTCPECSIYQAGQRTANLRQAIPPGSTGPRREKPDRQPAEEITLYVGDLPAGVYLLQLTNQQSSRMEKLIITH